MLEIVVIEIIAAIRSVVTIMPKVIRVTGRIAQSVRMILRQKCMSIMAQMNTTLRS